MQKTYFLLIPLLCCHTLVFADIHCIESSETTAEYASAFPHFQEIAAEIRMQQKILSDKYPERSGKLQDSYQEWFSKKIKICSLSKDIRKIVWLERAISEYKDRLKFLIKANSLPDFKVSHDQYPPYVFNDFDSGKESIYYPQSIVNYAKYFLYHFSNDKTLRSEYSDSIAGGTFSDLIAMTHVYLRQPYGCDDVWIYNMVIHKYSVDRLYFDKNGNKISKEYMEKICKIK